MWRREAVLWLLTFAALGGGVWVGWVKPIGDHLRWSRRVEHDLQQLAHKRPPGVTRG